MENEKSLKLLWRLKIGMRLLKRLKGVYWGFTRPRFFREATKNFYVTLRCAASVWIQDNNISVWMLMDGGATSELGLWMFDLSVTQQVQDQVHDSDRRFVGGVQNSLQYYSIYCRTL
ncbi:solute carrier family 40 member 2-like [Papaver somniferum]|nr:solute carrier family 40 member 2-like [Papaver somniferum]